MLPKLRRNTDIFQGDMARLCRENLALMRGRELWEVSLLSFIANSADKKIAVNVKIRVNHLRVANAA